MKYKVKMIIMSHLSDSLVEMNYNIEIASMKIKFVKLLVFKFPNTDIEISSDEADKLWEEAVN